MSLATLPNIALQRMPSTAPPSPLSFGTLADTRSTVTSRPSPGRPVIPQRSPVDGSSSPLESLSVARIQPLGEAALSLSLNCFLALPTNSN